MKTIENWEVIEIIDGKEKPGLPLPGCKIRGEIDGDLATIETSDVNLTRLIAVDTKGEIFTLSGAREEYKNLLNSAIELSKQEQSIESER